MNAETARLMAKNHAQKTEADREIKIRHTVREILDKVRRAAETGGTSILFGVDMNRLTHACDIDEVRNRLRKLGFSFSEEKDMGFEYERINW